MLFNGLRPGEKRALPAVKNRAAHGGEECAARMVKTKADALGWRGTVWDAPEILLFCLTYGLGI